MEKMILSSQYRGHKQIHIRRQGKMELVKAVMELEKRGFECVIPIREAKVYGKNFKDKARFYQGKWMCGRKDNVDSYEQVYYETIMRKKS